MAKRALAFAGSPLSLNLWTDGRVVHDYHELLRVFLRKVRFQFGKFGAILIIQHSRVLVDPRLRPVCPGITECFATSHRAVLLNCRRCFVRLRRTDDPITLGFEVLHRLIVNRYILQVGCFGAIRRVKVRDPCI